MAATYVTITELEFNALLKSKKKMTPSTVKEIIEKLQQLPQDLPCYIRPKYWGNLDWCDDAPINTNGICEMEASKYTDDKESVTFLV